MTIDLDALENKEFVPSLEERRIIGGLIALGAGWDGSRIIWHNNHCFYFHPTDGFIEL